MEIKQQADNVIARTYGRYPLALIKGNGCTLYDDRNRAYTDFIAGIAVCNLGHAHPGLAKAGGDPVPREFDRHPQRLQHVGGAGRGRGRAVAVLADGYPGAGSSQPASSEAVLAA